MIFHYVGGWIAWLSTLAAGLGVMSTVGASPVMMAVCFVGTISVKLYGNYFSQFDMAEALMRDTGWALYRPWKGDKKFAPKKAAKKAAKKAKPAARKAAKKSAPKKAAKKSAKKKAAKKPAKRKAGKKK